MKTDQSMVGEEVNVSPNRRPTIGLLLEDIAGGGKYQYMIWAGVADAAKRKDTNLLCFAGGHLWDLSCSKEPQNMIFSLADQNNIDGLIILGSFTSHVSHEEFSSFCNRYKPLPIVTITAPQPGIPNIDTDTAKGVREAVNHLIEDHRRQRIAFIRGPQESPEAEKRFCEFKRVLTEKGLYYPELVLYGDFFPPTIGEEKILELLNRGVSFDAVIAANDYLALGAMKTLIKKGIKIPEDVAFIGCDDIEDAKAVTPSLTTIRQHFYEQGKRAVETLIDLIEGKEITEGADIDTALIKRRSCGCFESGLIQPQALTNTHDNWTIDEIPTADIVNEIIKSIETEIPRSKDTYERVNRLFDTLLAVLKGDSSKIFLRTLNEVLDQTTSENSNVDVAIWQNAISIMRNEVFFGTNDKKVLTQIENLWYQAQLMIAHAAQQAPVYQRLQTEQQTRNLREIGERLITTIRMEDLMEVLAQELRRLEIPGCYVFLYDRGSSEQASLVQEKIPEYSRLMLKYENKSYEIFDQSEPLFKTIHIVPKSIRERKERYNIVIAPLHFRTEQLGFVLFEMRPKDALTCEWLRALISNALKGSLLVQEVQQGLVRVKKAHETARVVAEAIINEDLRGTLDTIVKGTKDVLGCDVVSLYAYNPVTKKLDLAPTIAGQLFNALPPIDDEQMKPGWLVNVMLNRDELYIAEITAEVDLFKERRFTKAEKIVSCVGIPFEAVGQKVGVMFVNYRKCHHFTAEELEDIKFYARQAAAAIRNAQLYEDATRRTGYLVALYNAGQAITGILALDEILQRILDQAKLITGRYMEPARFSQIILVEEGKLQLKAMSAMSPASLFLESTQKVSSIDSNSSKKVGIAGMVAKTGLSELVNDVSRSPDYIAFDPETRSELAVPIKIGEKVIGVINVEHSHYNAFNEEDLKYLESLAAQAAIAIQNARYFEELTRSLEELKVLDKRKTEFLSTVSHELRTPLSPIQNCIECMLSGMYGPVTDKQKTRLEIALSSTREESQLIDNLLDLVRIQEGRVSLNLELANITIIINDVINILEYYANQKKISIMIEPHINDSLEIRMDPPKIKQVLTNLIRNAIKFTPDNGQITISAFQSKHQLMIQVADTGIGIPEEECARIFERFYQADSSLTRKVGGSGIGLSIVKTFIEMHGGCINVISKVGEGSKFSFTLPY